MIKSIKKTLRSKTLTFFGVMWPTIAIMLNTAIDNVALLHDSLGDHKYFIAVSISSGAGYILRHYTNKPLGEL